MATWECPQDWSEWTKWLAAGLHGRCRWRLPILLLGILFARGPRTVASWLRAAGIGRGFSGYYYFISAVGRKSKSVAARLFLLLLRKLSRDDRLLLALDDTPTKRYGPKVQGAGIHHNPTPGPADAKYVYGHIWVTLSWVVRHPLWGTIGLPLLAALYVRRKNISALPKQLGWQFQTKLQQGVDLVAWAAKIALAAGKRLWVVADGAYAKRPFLKPLLKLGVVVVSRLRKDAAPEHVATETQKRAASRARPAAKVRHRSASAWPNARRPGAAGKPSSACSTANRSSRQYKSFLATYRPAYGTIRVVIVQEAAGPQFFFCTDPDASVSEILEAFADRAAIEQDFHDLKVIWGVGQQQLRHLWANIGAYHLCLWMHSLVELWAWAKSKAEICDRRDSPWDDPGRRPSHADRRKALRRTILQLEYLSLARCGRAARKIAAFAQQLVKFAV